MIPESASQQQGRAAPRAKKPMAYTVKQVAAMSGVSVRTLHFYDETGLLNPAYLGANGYRFYEEPQLLKLQQILFYRELGFELKQIKRIIGRRGFGIVAALQSHRKVLEQNLSRTRTLIETIDKTIEHLRGTRKMKTEELFGGFSVAAGDDRFGEHIKLDGEPVDCKVSGRDTNNAMCIFEFRGGWPRHLHHEQDEWIYIIEGEFEFILGEESVRRLRPGESIFIPRKVPHVWYPIHGAPGKIINIYQPAGRMEEFFRKLQHLKDLPTREQVLNKTYSMDQIIPLHDLFDAHGMDLLRPTDFFDRRLAELAESSYSKKTPVPE